MKYIKKFRIMGIVAVIFFVSGCSWMYQINQSSEFITDMTKADEPYKVSQIEFVNQFDESSSTADLKGEVWITNMIFTKCPTVCGLMTPNMMLLQEAIIEEELDVKLVSFTVDPEFDSPEVLQTYGKAYGANFDHWSFVTGYSPDEMKEFSRESFKAPIEEMPDTDDIMHATSFFLIDENGDVIRKYDGLNSDIKPYIDDLKQILKK